MKNIHLLPTDKPSTLYYLGKELKLRYVKDLPVDSDIAVNQYLYITSDEDIKEGDWCYHPLLRVKNIPGFGIKLNQMDH